MSALDGILQRSLAGERFTREEIVFLLSLQSPGELAALYHAAYEQKLRVSGNKVFLRGLIEISNVCRKNCLYCGIRRDNAGIRRFTMTEKEILTAAEYAFRQQLGSVVLQGGENHSAEYVRWIEGLIRSIKELSGGRLGITLSLGEHDLKTYRLWREAGAHRYLLRIESSNPELYAKLHPADHRFEERLQALRDLRTAGYQVGTGIMSNLPFQTMEDLANDVEFFRELDVDMIGMGPYIRHHAAPLGKEFPDYGCHPAEDLELALKMIAVTRLQLKTVNIASTTALQTLDEHGRERGLLAGANVIMPNIGECAYRGDYLLYENKPSLNETAASERQKLETAVRSIGEEIAFHCWGDSLHARERGLA